MSANKGTENSPPPYVEGNRSDPAHYGYDQHPQEYGYGQQQPPGYARPQNVAVVVSQPGTIVRQNGVPPADHLVLSIVSCFFCWPMAICALVYSSNSRNAATVGDYTTAASQGRNARNIAIAAIICGIIIVIATVVARVVLLNSYTYTSICSGYDCY